jgi:acetylornithine/succinyldiaminopimelate/putrescine aminotransferase
VLIGVEFSRPVKPVIDRALQEGLVVINAGDNVLRVCPPLTIQPEDIDLGITLLARCLESLDTGEGSTWR